MVSTVSLHSKASALAAIDEAESFPSPSTVDYSSVSIKAPSELSSAPVGWPILDSSGVGGAFSIPGNSSLVHG